MKNIVQFPNKYIKAAGTIAEKFDIKDELGRTKTDFYRKKTILKAFTLVCGPTLSADQEQLKNAIHLFRWDFEGFVNEKDKTGETYERVRFKGFTLHPNDVTLHGDASNPSSAFFRACISFEMFDSQGRRNSLPPFEFLRPQQMYNMSQSGVDGIIFEKNGNPEVARSWIDLSYARRPVPKGF